MFGGSEAVGGAELLGGRWDGYRHGLLRKTKNRGKEKKERICRGEGGDFS